MLVVREARVEDLDAMIELGKRGHEKSANAQYKFDDQRARLLGLCCIMDRNKCALVVIGNDTVVVGVLLGIEEQYAFLKMTYATDLAVYAESPGGGRMLLQAFEKWALEDRKVDQLLMGVSFGGKSARAAQALYTRMGFTHDGGLFTKNRRQQCLEP